MLMNKYPIIAKLYGGDMLLYLKRRCPADVHLTVEPCFLDQVLNDYYYTVRLFNEVNIYRFCKDECFEGMLYRRR